MSRGRKQGDDGSMLGDAPSAYLEALFARRGPLEARVGTAPFALDREERLLGVPFPEELRAFVQLQERFELPEMNTFEPLDSTAPFLLEGDDAALRLVVAARQMYWPVAYRAHFWGVYPIGTRRGGDVFLASLEPGPKCRVYRYDHEERVVRLAASSIGELLWEESLAETDEDAPVPAGLRGAKGKASPLWNASALAGSDDGAGRDEWVTDLLIGERPNDLPAATAQAPSFTAFAKEQAALARAPHLLLYWLGHHAFAGNLAAFADVHAVATKHGNPLVRSFAAALEGLVANRDTPHPQLFDIPSDKCRDILDLIDRELPVKLLGPDAKKNRQARERAAATATQALFAAAQAAGQDRISLMEAHPANLALHELVVAELAEKADALATQARTLLGIVRGSIVLDSMHRPNPTEELLSSPDPRLLVPMIALVRTGMPRTERIGGPWTHLVRALGRSKDPRAIECLFEEGHRYRDDCYHLNDVLEALDGVDDPRQASLGIAGLKLASKNFGSPYIVGPAAAALHRYDPAQAEAMVGRVLESHHIGGEQDLLAAFAIAASTHLMRGTWTGLMRLLREGWTGKLLAQVAFAVARLDPDAAVAPLLARLDGDTPSPRKKLEADEHGAILLGLLVAEPAHARGLAESSAFLERLTAGPELRSWHLEGLRYVLFGVREAGARVPVAHIEPFLTCGEAGAQVSTSDQPQAARVRERAAQALKAIRERYGSA